MWAGLLGRVPAGPRHTAVRMPADAALIEAFDAIYREHSVSVYRFCVALTRDPAKAEDIAADCFVKAFGAFERGRPEDVHAWLFHIARNVLVDHHRRDRARYRLAQLVGRAGRGRVADVEQWSAVRQEVQELTDALSRMREKDAILIAMRVTTGMTFAQIGAATNMTERAAKLATYRALDRLRALIPEVP